MNRSTLSTIKVAILFGALGFAPGCHLDDVVGPCHNCGHQVTRTFDLAGFDEIDCRSALRATVRQSDEFRVEVRYPQRLEDDLQIRRDGTRLRIGLDHACLDCDVHVLVKLPQLRRLEVSEASRVELERISTTGMVGIWVESASRLDGELSADRTELRLDAASEADLSGSTDQLRLQVSALSRANLRSFTARRADVELNGASQATLRVSDWLDLTASGLSVLHLLGNPQLGRLDLSGGSRLDRER